MATHMLEEVLGAVVAAHALARACCIDDDQSVRIRIGEICYFIWVGHRYVRKNPIAIHESNDRGSFTDRD